MYFVVTPVFAGYVVGSENIEKVVCLAKDGSLSFGASVLLYDVWRGKFIL